MIILAILLRRIFVLNTTFTSVDMSLTYNNENKNHYYFGMMLEKA